MGKGWIPIRIGHGQSAPLVSNAESANQTNPGATFHLKIFFCTCNVFHADAAETGKRRATEQGEGTVCDGGCKLDSHQQHCEYTVRVLARSRQPGGCRKFGSAVCFFYWSSTAGRNSAAGKTKLEEKRCLGWGRLNY